MLGGMTFIVLFWLWDNKWTILAILAGIALWRR